MLKFKFLLWALTKLLQRTIKKSPDCAKYVKGKELVFQIQTHDGVGRYFTLKEAPINVPQPRGRLKIPCHSALFTAKRPVRTALVGFSAHISVLHA
jgi:hypothetical protein